MRKTNIQIWDEHHAILLDKQKKFIDNYFINTQQPTSIYRADIDQIKEIPISYISVYSNNEPRYYKKPTKENISALVGFINDFDNQKKEIMFHYTDTYSTYTSSGAYKLSDILASKTMSFNKDELIPVQKELNEKYAAKEGFKACHYCGKQVLENTLVPYKIIFQSSRPDPFSRSGYKKFVDQQTYMYCSKECGVHDQWAHEG